MEKINEINTRDYMITCWLADISQLDMFHFIESFGLKIKYYCIGAVEKTELEKEHFHVFIKFLNPIRASTLIKKLNVPSTHFEKMRTTIQQCFNYCTEEGCFKTNVDENLFLREQQCSDAYSLLVFDIVENNFTLADIIKKYSKIAILHISNIKMIYQILEEQKTNDYLLTCADEEFFSLSKIGQ